MVARTEAGWVLASRYVMTEVIGTGGMATVWHAYDRQLGREVAVKILHSELTGQPRTRIRFEREARHAAALSNPYVVTIHDVGTDGERFFIVMEFVDGLSLRQVLDRLGHLSTSVASSIAVDVLNGLAEAHGRGILHRDLKPANILVARNGTAKLVDFGIARAMDWSTITEDGTFLGTALYAAPEQLVGSTVAESADLFSLGRVLEECVLGSAMLASHKDSERLAESQLPVAFRDVLVALTEPEARDRPTSARVVAAELAGFQGDRDSVRKELEVISEQHTAADHTFAAAQSTPPIEGAAGPRRQKRYVRRWALLAALVLAAAVAGSVYGLTRSGGPSGAGRTQSSPPPRVSSSMLPGQVLQQGQSIISPNRRFELTMRPEGNLVLSEGSSSLLWVSGSGGHRGAYAVLQSDGDLVVYPRGSGPPGPGQPTPAVWASLTTGNPGATLSVKSSGNVEITTADSSTPVWQTHTALGSLGSQLFSGGQLHPGQYLQAPSSTYRLENEGGSLRLVTSSNPGCVLWTETTSGNRSAFATMGPDGALTLVDPGTGKVWFSSNTGGNSGASLSLQSDGHLYVLSASGVTLWSAPTNSRCLSR